MDFFSNVEMVLVYAVVSWFTLHYLGDFHCWMASALKREKYRDGMLNDSRLVAFIFNTFGTILLLPFIVKFLVECLEIILFLFGWMIGVTGEYIRFTGEDDGVPKKSTWLWGITKTFLTLIGSVFIAISVLFATLADMLGKITGRVLVD